jgi:acyl dehydratase
LGKIEHFGYKEVGYKFETEPRYATNGEVDMFCDVTGLRDDAFLRDDGLAALGLDRRVVPGLFIMAIMFSGLIKSGLTHDGLFVGTDNVKFKENVHPYDSLHTVGEVIESRVTSKGDRVVVRYTWRVINQNDVVVAEGVNTCFFPNPYAK